MPRPAVVSAEQYKRLARTEADLQDAVEGEAERWGWLRYHTRVSWKSAGGFPDLVLARGGRVIVAELKGPRGAVEPEQRRWLDELRLCEGIEVYVWTFDEWDSGEIARVLM
jgi:hypothetical protein